MNLIGFLNKSLILGFCLPMVLVFSVKIFFPEINIKTYIQSNVAIVFLNALLVIAGGFLLFSNEKSRLAMKIYYYFLFFFGAGCWIMIMQ